MSHINIKLKDVKRNTLIIDDINFNVIYEHIRKIFIFKDILIINGISYKYSSRIDLLNDLQTIIYVEKILNKPTVLKRLSTNNNKVLVKELLFLEYNNNNVMLKRDFCKIHNMEMLRIQSKSNGKVLILNNTYKNYRKKKNVIKYIHQTPVINISGIDSAKSFNKMLKHIIRDIIWK